MVGLYNLLYSQFSAIPLPKGPFTDQIVIVTGSNSGIGVDAARHYANLDAKKVILAVRNLESGNDVKKSIEETTKRTGVVEVWKLDMSSSASVRAFADRVNKELPRLNVAALNAGVATSLFKLSDEGFEETLQVNVISTAYLTVLLLPKLYATADKYNVTPRLNITSSSIHEDATLTKEMLAEGKPIAWLNTEENAKRERSYYSVSKLLEIFYVQELAKHIKTKDNGQTKVILNTFCPGLCHSNLTRNLGQGEQLFMTIFKALLARSSEVGSRTIVNAGENDNFETHGKYLANCVVSPPSEHVRSKEGQDAQVKVYNELHDILYKIDPETATIV
ncbi:short-chain dehydrogenase/reductase-like protein [Umbelopsis sp. PMI_123]|nr:short-chain dehydrogenase/reductase-like protein [Umbelopsis sp. PMI_123]